MDEQLRGRVVQINVNPDGGVPKHRVPEVEITVNGVKGDRQRDRRHHGGPERAVCLFSHERVTALQAEGNPIEPGSTGENLTIAGIDWDALTIGDCLRVGDQVVLEISDYTTPCKNIAGSFRNGEFSRILHKLHPGWSRLYARVLTEGVVREGDVVQYEIASG